MALVLCTNITLFLSPLPRKVEFGGKKNEGLAPGCTSKGKHSGTGGRTIRLFVAISYDVGVVVCHEYKHLDGAAFKNIINNHFEDIFVKSHKRYQSKMFLQDGDPSQNSAAAKKALEKIKAEVFSIPPRSPDLNPVENLFHTVKRNLRLEALENKITSDTPQQFAES